MDKEEAIRKKAYAAMGVPFDSKSYSDHRASPFSPNWGYPLPLGEPMTLTFSGDQAEALRFLFESEKHVHGQGSPLAVLNWLWKRGMPDGWFEKGKAFVKALQDAKTNGIVKPNPPLDKVP